MCGRAERQVWSRIARPTAIAIPCSTPMKITPSAEISAKRNSIRLERHMRAMTPTLMSRAPMKTNTPARAAKRNRVRVAPKGRQHDRDHRRRQPDELGRAAGERETVVRAGEASTGKAPTSPAATLARPTPTKSRLRLASTPSSSAAVLDVAAVWERITITRVTDVVSTTPHWPDVNQCKCHSGGPTLHRAEFRHAVVHEIEGNGENDRDERSPRAPTARAR